MADDEVDLVRVIAMTSISQEKSRGRANMKKTKLSLSVLCFLTFVPTFAWAEWFLDIYGGDSLTQDARATAEVRTYSIFGSSSQRHAEEVDFDSSFTMGRSVRLLVRETPMARTLT